MEVADSKRELIIFMKKRRPAYQQRLPLVLGRGHGRDYKQES